MLFRKNYQQNINLCARQRNNENEPRAKRLTVQIRNAALIPTRLLPAELKQKRTRSRACKSLPRRWTRKAALIPTMITAKSVGNENNTSWNQLKPRALQENWTHVLSSRNYKPKQWTNNKLLYVGCRRDVRLTKIKMKQKIKIKTARTERSTEAKNKSWMKTSRGRTIAAAVMPQKCWFEFLNTKNESMEAHSVIQLTDRSSLEQGIRVQSQGNPMGYLHYLL